MNLKYRMFFVLLLVFFLVGTILSAVYTGNNESSAQEQGIKTIRVAYFGDAPHTLDLANHRIRGTQTVVRNFTDGLLQAMPDGSLVPDLAESIKQIDPITYEIKIKQGVTFHNGDPMTADDIVFSITRLAIEGGMEGITSPRRSLVGPVESVGKKDDYAITVKLSEPHDMTRSWYNIEIMPKKYVEEVGIEEYIKKPIGVGPFKVIEADLPNFVALERYENYYGGAAGLPGEVDRIPALDRVIFNFIAEDATRIAALLSGEVDIITNVPTDYVPLLQANPEIKVESEVGSTFVYLALNVNKAPFNDKRVRQAIAYAIDYDLLCEKVFSGYAEPKYGIPYLEPYKGEAGFGQFNVQSPYHYNPEKAKALLEEAGAIGLSTTIDTHQEFLEQVQPVAQMLSDVGLNVSVRVWELGVIQQEFKRWERDMFFNARGMGAKDPFAIDGSFSPGQAHNFCGYSNPIFDDLIKRAKIEGRDSSEGRDLFFKALDIILEDIPIVSIYSPKVIEASRINVKNFFPSGIGRVNLHRVDIE